MFNDSFAAGIEALAMWQQKDGSFLNLSSPNSKNFTRSKILHTTFATSLILSCLNSLKPTSELHQIKRKASDFLLKQKSGDWSFNYWFRNSEESKDMPYPDDLDDTFCALAALYEFQPSLFNGTIFAKIINVLTSTEIHEGGPYKTWLVTAEVSDIWKDVDIVVNSNIAYFLSLQEIELPNVTRFIEKAIKNDRLTSPYYHGSLPVIYFISRWYKGPFTKKLIIYLLNEIQKKEIQDNALLLAFSILSLLKLGASSGVLSKSIQQLLKLHKQQAWESYGFYIDPVMQGSKHYAGSKALTTAFCLSALAAYERKHTNITQLMFQEKNTSSKIHIDSAVKTITLQTFTHIDRTMNLEARKVVQQVIVADRSKQITLLPYYILSSMKTKKRIPNDILIRLGCASLYGWIAYTIYDNFLDNEGDPRTLPVANVSLRELTTLFTDIMKKHPDFIDLFKTIMNNIDRSNIWEITHCRFIPEEKVKIHKILLPEYGKYKYLADRSMGHALAPVAVLFLVGYKKNSTEVKLLLKFFYHYIIARQLDDDAHDFIDDLKKGHINAVGTLVIKRMKEIKSRYVVLPFDDVLNFAHEIFWKDVVVTISQDILRHVSKAKKTINDNQVIEDKEAFINSLIPIERSAKRALEEHTNVTGFLQSYK